MAVLPVAAFATSTADHGAGRRTAAAGCDGHDLLDVSRDTRICMRDVEGNVQCPCSGWRASATTTAHPLRRR